MYPAEQYSFVDLKKNQKKDDKKPKGIERIYLKKYSLLRVVSWFNDDELSLRVDWLFSFESSSHSTTEKNNYFIQN